LEYAESSAGHDHASFQRSAQQIADGNGNQPEPEGETLDEGLGNESYVLE
jgi:hypothetical protein